MGWRGEQGCQVGQQHQVQEQHWGQGPQAWGKYGRSNHQAQWADQSQVHGGGTWLQWVGEGGTGEWCKVAWAALK